MANPTPPTTSRVRRSFACAHTAAHLLAPQAAMPHTRLVDAVVTGAVPLGQAWTELKAHHTQKRTGLETRQKMERTQHDAALLYQQQMIAARQGVQQQAALQAMNAGKVLEAMLGSAKSKDVSSSYSYSYSSSSDSSDSSDSDSDSDRRPKRRKRNSRSRSRGRRDRRDRDRGRRGGSRDRGRAKSSRERRDRGRDRDRERERRSDKRGRSSDRGRRKGRGSFSRGSRSRR